MITKTNATPGRPRIFPGWYVVLGGMINNFFISVAFIYGFQAFFNPITEHFNWPRSVTAGAFSLQRLEGGIISPIAGFLVDRLGARTMALSGVTLIGLGYFGLSQMQEIWQYYACFLLISIGMSGGFAGFPAATVNWFHRQRGRALGILSAGPVPSGLFVPLVTLLIAAVGWRSALLILGVLILVICIPASLLVRHSPELYGYLPDGDAPVEHNRVSPERANAVQRGEKRDNPPARSALGGLSVREALRMRAFWLLATIFGIHQMGPAALFVVQIPYFESIGFSPEAAASTIAAFTVLSGIGRIGGGFLLETMKRKWILFVLMVANVVGLLLLVNITDYWLVIPFAFFSGCAFGGMIPARSVLITDYFGQKNFASIQGLSRSVEVLFGFVTPVMIGVSYDVMGSYAPAFLLIAALIALATPVVFFLGEPKKIPVWESRPE